MLFLHPSGTTEFVGITIESDAYLFANSAMEGDQYVDFLSEYLKKWLILF